MTAAELRKCIPDEQLFEEYRKRVRFDVSLVALTPDTIWWGLRTLLGIDNIHILGAINPVEKWAKEFDKYTYSREFLLSLIDTLTEYQQTEGALLVIKKLAEMDEENKRFEL